MIEILVIISLCKNTKENAVQRGKSGGIAIMYTILLWVGMEFWGAIVTGIILGIFGLNDQYVFLIYLVALASAALGGYVAVLISKIHPPINLFENQGNMASSQIET